MYTQTESSQGRAVSRASESHIAINVMHIELHQFVAAHFDTHRETTESNG
jgi:hypothetical protein